MLILPRNDSMKGVGWVSGEERWKEGGEGGRRKKKETAYTLGIEISRMDPSIAIDGRSSRRMERGWISTLRFFESIDRSIDRIFPLVFFTFFFFFFFPSFITRTKGKDKKSTRVPLMYAHTSPHPYTHVSASRLSPTTLRFTKLVAFLPPPPSWKFIVVSGVTNSRWKLERAVRWRLPPALRSIYRTPKQPSRADRPPLSVKRKTPISRLN